MKIWREIKKKRWALLILTLFWVLAFTVQVPSFYREGESLVSKNVGYSGWIGQDNPLRFTFSSKHNNMKSVRVWIKCQDKSVNVIYHMALSDLNGNVIKEENFRTDKAKEFFQMKFSPLADSQGKKYNLSIAPLEAEEGHAVAVALVRPSHNNYAFLGNQSTANALEMQYSYALPHAKAMMMLILLFVAFCSYVALLLLGGNIQKNYIVVVAFAALLIVISPFPHAVDEWTHGYKTFSIAAGEMNYMRKADGAVGAKIASNYEDIVSNNFIDIKTVLTNYEELSQPFSKNREFTVNELMSSYLPIAYIPSAIGVALMIAIGAPAFLTIWIGRLCIYACAALIGYWLLGKVNNYKNVLFLLLTMPFFLSFAGSIDADVMLNICAIAFPFLCLHYASADCHNRINAADIFVLLLSAAVLSSTKYLIYTPILLLYFIIPKKRFHSGRQRVMILVGALALVAAMAAWQVVLLRLFPYKEPRVENVDVMKQLAWVMQHPLKAFKVLAGCVMDMWSQVAFLKQYPTNDEHMKFRLIENLVPVSVWISGIVAGDKVTFVEERKEKIVNVAVPVFAVIISFLIVVSLYMGYNSVGANHVNGVQPRYFFPVFVPMVCWVGQKFKTVSQERKSLLLVPFISLIGISDMLLVFFNLM